MAAKEYLPGHLYLPPLDTFGARSMELADDFYRFRTELWAWPMGSQAMRRKCYRAVRAKGLENHYTSEPALYISLTLEEFSEVLSVACRNGL